MIDAALIHNHEPADERRQCPVHRIVVGAAAFALGVPRGRRYFRLEAHVLWVTKCR